MGTHDEEFAGTEEAWRDFRQTLADRIDGLAEDEFVLWELDVPERFEHPTGPYVQVSPSRAEVSSNRVLDEKFHLAKPERRMLRALGWQRPDKHNCNYWIDVDVLYADQVAALLVTALRDAFGVVHPTFLVDRTAPEPQEDVTEPALPIAQFPESHDQLEELIGIALGPDRGEPTPLRDDDGDWPYRSETAMVFVRLLPDVPVIRLFSELVVDVEDLDAAPFEVSVLNRDFDFKFMLRETCIVMSVDVPAWPFVPDHLRLMLDGMCMLAPRLDGDLAHRVSGRRFFEPSRGDAT